MAYKKRRLSKSPNKNEERRQRNEAAQMPVLGNCFPGVERLTLELTFYSQQGHLLLEDVRDIGVGDPCDLAAPCPGGCGDGQIDLKGKVESIIQRHDTSAEGTGRCNQTIYHSGQICGCEVRCQARVVYR